MKRRELNALCKSTCHLLLSRNNDINGFWGVGVLCGMIIRSGRWETAFRIAEPSVVRIFGCELTQSEAWSQTLFDLGVESIDGHLSFVRDGEYESRNERYLFSIALCMRQEERVGMAIVHGQCWPHDSSREWRRAYIPEPKIGYVPPSAKLRASKSTDSS